MYLNYQPKHGYNSYIDAAADDLLHVAADIRNLLPKFWADLVTCHRSFIAVRAVNSRNYMEFIIKHGSCM